MGREIQRKPASPGAAAWRTSLTTPKTLTLLLAATALVMRAYALFRSWFFADDFLLLSRFRRLPAAEAILGDYNGHLMPLQNALAGAAERVASLSYPLWFAILLALFGALVFSVRSLIHEASGDGLIGVAAMTLFVVGSIRTDGSEVWIASGLQALGLQLVLARLLLHSVRFLKDVDPRHRTSVILWCGLGILWWYLFALVIPIWLLVTYLLWRSDGARPDRLLIDRRVVGWSVGLLLSSFVYGLVATDPSNVALGISKVIGRLPSLWARAIAGVLGLGVAGLGPRGVSSGLGPSITWLAVGATVVVIAGCGLVLSRRLTWPTSALWLLVVGLVVFKATLAYQQKGALNGFDVISVYRYFPEIFVLIPLLVVVTFRTAQPLNHPVLNVLAKATLVGLLINAVWQNAQGAEAMAQRTAPAKTFLNNYWASFDRLEDPIVIDGRVPGPVLYPLFGKDARLSTLIELDDDPQPSSLWYGTDELGFLVPFVPLAPRHLDPSDSAEPCWSTDDTQATIVEVPPASIDDEGRPRILTLTYQATTPGTAIVAREGSHHTEFEFELGGPHILHLQVWPGTETVRIAGDHQLCVTDVTISSLDLPR